MSCHEVAALRLGLMNVLGVEDEAEKLHELAELGEAATAPGALRGLTEARDLSTLGRLYESTLVDLHEKVAQTPASDPRLPYLRTLMVLTKQVEMELRTHVEGLHRMYRDLEEVHDFVHEMYPAKTP